jgi:hypothetical protein
MLIESLERHEHLQLDPVMRSALLDISAATSDRLPRPVRPRQRLINHQTAVIRSNTRIPIQLRKRHRGVRHAGTVVHSRDPGDVQR